MNAMLTTPLRIFLLSLMLFFASNSVLSQSPVSEDTQFCRNPADEVQSFLQPKLTRSENVAFLKPEAAGKITPTVFPDRKPNPDVIPDNICPSKKAPLPPPFEKVVDDEKESSRPEKKDDFRLRSALIQTGVMLGVQHGFRLTQEKTRRELGGPFFRDWGQAVKALRGWRDGDNSFTNYFAHPLQGGVSGRIYITNSREASRVEFGKSRKYWKTRMNTLAWSAFWSTQFEMGPVSEASLGNVGLRTKNGYSTMAWVDLVMTPTAGTAIIVGEDIIEKYLIKKWIRKNGGKANVKIKVLRSLLTPTISLNNLLRGKMPWVRNKSL